jgi:hypothetical protein
MAAELVQRLPTRSLARTARDCAHATMLVVLRVTIALLSAAFAHEPARHELLLDDVAVGLNASRQHRAHHHADIGAILIEPYASDELVEILALAEARTRTRCAAVSAVGAGIDAEGQRVAIDDRRLRVAENHVAYVVHGRPLATSARVALTVAAESERGARLTQNPRSTRRERKRTSAGAHHLLDRVGVMSQSLLELHRRTMQVGLSSTEAEDAT